VNVRCPETTSCDRGYIHVDCGCCTVHCGCRQPKAVEVTDITDQEHGQEAETKRADEAEADVQRTIDEYYEATMAVHAEVDARAREEAARKIEEYHSTECPRRYNAHDCGCLALAALVRGR
jgi:hypothetical protein